MKANHTRRPLQQTADKAEKPFFGGKLEKQKSDNENAFFQARKIDGNQDTALEQEADAVANKVTESKQGATKSSQRMGQMSVQKKGKEEEKDAKATQKKEQKEEKDETKAQKKEEDRKEEKPQKKDDKDKDKEGVQKKGKEEEKKEDKPQKKGKEEEKDTKATQKKEQKEEKDDKASPQKKEEKTAGGVEKTEGKQENPADKFDRLLNKSKGGGSPLPGKLRTQLEQKMGANFERVRIHTGQEAVELCNLSKAQAFTHGNDVYFNSGKFDPDSTAGLNLLAHELTHVIQQNGTGK